MSSYQSKSLLQAKLDELGVKRNSGNRKTTQKTSNQKSLLQQAVEEYKSTNKVDLAYVENYFKDAEKYLTSAGDSYGEMKTSTSASIYNQRKAEADDLRAKSFNISKYLDDNRSAIGEENYKELKNKVESVKSAIGNAVYSFYNANDYYSRWKSDDHYFKNAQGARNDRLKWYDEQKAKVAELENEYKTANSDRKKEITAEMDSINAELRQYEHSENGWTNKKLDDYYGITENEDFATGSANRTFENPSRENLDLFTAMMDTSQWYWDADGNRYDALGNLVYKAGEAQTDERNVVIHPLANDERFAVQDRYGMWKNATEEERREASAVREWSDGYDTWSNAVLAGDEYFWDRLTEKEVSIYYYLLNTQGSDAASAFLDDMEVVLAQRETGANNQEWTERYDESGFLGKVFMNAASVPASVFGGALAWIDDSARELRGEEINPYNGSHSLMHYSNTVRGLTAEDLDETGFKIPVIGFSLGDIYQVGMSRLDSALSTAMFGGIGTVFLGTGAAANEAYRLYQQGASEEQITLGAFAAGAAETVFEYASFDKLIKMKDVKTAGQWVKSALIQGGIESYEEGFTEISNILTNAIIMRGESDWADLVVQNGGSEKGAFWDATMQTIQSMFGGFLGGVGAGITQGGKSYFANQAKVTNTGRTIMGADGGVDALKALADEVAGVSNDKTKKAITKQAGKVSGDIATGKNIVGKAAAAVKNTVNANKTGRLYGAVQDANNLANAPKNKADIVKSLERNGVYSETAEDIADALVAKYNGQDLTRAQEKLLEAVENDKDVQDAIRGIVNNQQSTMGQRSKNIRDFNSDVEVGVKAGVVSKVTGVSLDVAKEYVKGNQNAIKESFAESRYEVSADGKTIDKDGNIINVIGIESVKDGKIMLKTENGTIDASEVSFATEDEAFVYSAISNMDVSAESAWALVKGFNKADGVSARLYAIDIPLAYKYGKLNYKAGLQNLSLTPSQSATAFQMGRSDAAVEATEQASTEGTLSEKNADKKIIFEGFTYNEKTAKENQKASMAAIDMISKMSNLEIHVYKSYKKKGNYYAMVNGKERLAPNGYFADGNKVYIDINAGNQGEGLMLYTLSHEIGHYIAKWNAQDFKAISDFLFEHYGENVPIYDLLEAQKNKLKKSYKADGKQIPGEAQLEKEAHEELVCDMLSRMLADKNAYHKLMELKQQDLNAFQKLGQAIKNALEKLAKALGIYDTLNPDFLYAASKENIGEEAFRQLQNLYIKAFVQADANFQATEKNTTEDGGVEEIKESIRRTQKMSLTEQLSAYYSKDPSKRFKQSDAFYFGVTPDILSKSNLDANPLAMGQDDFKKSTADKHNIPRRVLKNLHKDISDPVFSFTAGKQSAIMTKDIDGDGKPLVVAIHGGRTMDRLPINRIASIYGVDDMADWVGKQIKGGCKFRVYDIGKANAMLQTHGYLAAVGTQSDGFWDIITEKKTGVNTESVEAMDVEVDTNTESVAPNVMKSERTWTESDYVQEREQAAKEIAKAIGVSVKKAKAYIDSVNSIAKMIAEDRVRLDYFSSPGRSSFVGNVEYGGSFDFSTLCKKRRLLTGTFTAIQKALPNTALTADEILDIRNRMKEAGLEVSCGLCYVEGSRANMGQFAKEFLRLYKQYYPDEWQPNMADVNTPDGIEWVRINHPECYEQYEYFWNHYGTLKPGDKNLFASQQKPKLYQLHTEYKGEILEKFNDDENVEEKNINGGIRLQSFSDFEIVHLIDTMQIIMDMSRVGLAGQAYTKVPDFAWALGDTGLKINLSLIAKGVDENGKLIFDDVEGMPIAEAMKLRDRYSQNVGTILVAFNDEQLLAAMADDRVDFIIPFHRSQWKKSQYEAMGLPAKTKDYTYMQNEKFIKPQYHEYRGRMVQDKATNYMPNEYWDFSKSGKENAEAYLEMCARNNKRPKFYKLLQNNGDGSYSLKADGSTDGYWKLLIDFKMYDNDGNGSPQMPVKPDFNMDEAQRMLNDYQGGHSNFPVAYGIVDEFVQEYKQEHNGAKFSDRDFTYKELTAKNPLQGRIIDKKRTVKITSDGSIDREWVVSEVLKQCESMQTKAPAPTYFVNVPDIGKNVEIVGDAIRHGFIKFQPKNGKPVPPRSLLNARVSLDLPHILRNSIEVNRSDRGDNAQVEFSHILIGVTALESSNGATEYCVVRSVVEARKNQGAILTEANVIGKLHAINAKKIGKPRVQAGTNSTNALAGSSLFAYSVADLLNDVKYEFDDTFSNDVYKHFGMTRKGNEFSKFLKFSDRDTDSVSNRSLLANAFEGLAQNEIERNKIQEYKGKIDLINAEEKKLSELNEKIKELSFSKGPRDTKKIRDLQFKARQTANRINTYDKQLLRLEASKPLQDVLAREKQKAYKKAEQRGKDALNAYKEKAAKTQRELLERWQESRKKGIESREKTAMKHNIQRVVGELNQLLLNGDKTRHVPENLKKAVADALALVNMDTVGAEERAAKYAALIAKETDPDKIDAYTVTMENILRQGEKMGQRLKDLRDAYEEIQNSDDPDIANAYDPVIAASLKELSQSIGNTSLRNMTIEQLSDVYDMYKMVLTRVRDANKSFLNDKKEAISSLASRVVGEVKKVGGEHKYRAAFLDFVRKFGWDNLKPVYAFEHLGSSTLKDAFNNVRAGEDVWAVDVTEARKYYLDKSKKYGYDSWDFKKKHRFESASDLEFELTLDQILSLYAYSKREQSLDHLRLGGFVFDSNIETYKEQGSKLIKYKVNTADAHQITPEILANITGLLTNEQKAFVDEMQDYLSTVMGAKGNEVTMQMYGVKLFKEKFYFPLKSAKQFMFEQNEVSGEVRIKNSGFTNKVVAKANNPVILNNFMDVWAGHVNDMSMYHAFVLPLEDFNRIFNYNSPKQDGVPSVSVKGTIQNAYSPAAVNYVRQLITDLNGGARSDSTTGIINKMIGLFKKGSVFASLSVVVQQPSAIARAAALVDTKYFIGPKVDHKRHKALWDEVKQYAPVAIIKEMGYFDTNMGKSTQDFITGKEYSGFKDKMKALVVDGNYRDEVLSKAPALADEIAWCGIWEAVKRETKAKNPEMDVKSEAFLKMAGERFTEVITKTQVYDSVLSRSGMMRSKDTGMKMATAFMAEPTTSINMIADALLQGKRGNKKYAASAVGAVIASQILNSILVSFVYAGRDDDEEETYLEKYIGTLTGEMLDSLNPATYIPFIKDIVSIVQGYDVERSDMAVVSDLWKSVESLSKDNVSAYRKVEGFAGSIAQIFGLPVKNIMRDARGICQTIMSFMKGEQTTGAGIGYAVKSALPEWIGGGDVSNKQQLYEAYLSGDSEQLARVQSRFEDQSAINAAMRSAIKEHYTEGEIDFHTAEQYLIDFGGMEDDDAYWKVEEWKYESESGEDFKKYNDFYEAVQTGKNLKAVIQKYTDNGVDKKTLASQITFYFKPLYREMSNTERAAIKGYLLNAYQLLGYNRSEKSKDIDKWLKD